MKNDSVIDFILNQEDQVNSASEELRKCLNDIIGRRKLNGSVVLMMLARLSAGYIHQMQSYYDRAGEEVMVAEDFNTLLTTYLTDLDMCNVGHEPVRKPDETWS